MSAKPKERTAGVGKKRRAERIPTTYTELACHLYNIVTAEGQRRNVDDKPIPFRNLSRPTLAAWRDDAAALWSGEGSDHPQQWARDMMVLEVKRLKALL